MNPIQILIARTDRLGDVILSLPSLEYIRKELPEVSIDFLVQETYVPVLLPFLETLDIKPITAVNKKYSHFLGLYCQSKQAWNVFKAGTNQRVGIYSKPWSFVFFTDGIRQKRSEALKSEAEYNLDLAKMFVSKIKGSAGSYEKTRITIPVEPKAKLEAETFLQKVGLSSQKGFVVFHPGMRGSALNLSPEQYLGLIHEAEKTWRLPIALSVGPVERDQEIAKTLLEAIPSLHVIQNLEIAVLREVFRMAKLVVAPSTGPLHLAHFVGTKTIGLYPPVKTQSVVRWAPWGGSGKSSVYFPNVQCPGEKNCIGEKCQKYFCMEKEDWVTSVFARSAYF